MFTLIKHFKCADKNELVIKVLKKVMSCFDWTPSTCPFLFKLAMDGHIFIFFTLDGHVCFCSAI